MKSNTLLYKFILKNREKFFNFIFHVFTENAGCTCKDLIDNDGQGNCQGNTSYTFGKKICYVNQPTTCPDARENTWTKPGEKLSAKACEIGTIDKFRYTRLTIDKNHING